MALLYFKDLYPLGRQMRHVWHYRLGYEKKPVYAWIDILSNKPGDYTWEIGTFKEEKSDKTIKSFVQVEVPVFSRNNNFPIIPDDLASYVLGIGPGAIAKHKEYVNKLSKCYEKTQEESIKAMLETLPTLIPIVIEKLELNPSSAIDATKRIIFYYNGKRIAGLPAISKYWQAHYLAQLKVFNGVCAVTAQESSQLIVGVAPIKVQKVSQALPTGSALCSFYSSAFFAYGWEGAENSPIRAKVLIESYAFLNFLLQDERFNRKIDDHSLLYWSPSITINNSFWYSDFDLDEIVMTFAKDESSNESKAKTIVKHMLLKGVTKPIEELVKEGTDFDNLDMFFLLIKGNYGRSSISFFESFRVSNLINNIARFVESHLAMKSFYFFTPCNLAKTLNLGIPVINIVKSVLFGEELPDCVLLTLLKDATINKGAAPHKVLLMLHFYLALKGKTIDNMNEKEKYAFLSGQKYWLLAKMQMIRQSKQYKTTDVAWRYQYIINNDIESQERLKTLAEDIYAEINYSSLVLKDAENTLVSNIAKQYKETTEAILKLTNVDNLPYTFQEKAWFVLGGAIAKNEYYDKSNL